MLTLKFPDAIKDVYCDSDNNKVSRDANGRCVVDPEKVRLRDFMAIGFTVVADPIPDAPVGEQVSEIAVS
jgi:hypothetical protein